MASDPSRSSDVEQVVAEVKRSRKYRHVLSDLVRQIAAQELHKRARTKDAIKATKNRLHQVTGAFLEGPLGVDAILADLRGACARGDTEWRAACQRIMRRHASTRERLPIVETFFRTTLADIAPVRSILDVACGLNPLALPWMPVAPDVRYSACDVFEDVAAVLNGYFELAGTDGQVFVCDVTQSIPSIRADVALVLKTIPCLEHIDPHIGIRMLDGLQVPHILVSFPAQSLGGHSRGMAATYDAHFRALIAGCAWEVKRFDFAGELAFLVTK